MSAGQNIMMTIKEFKIETATIIFLTLTIGWIVGRFTEAVVLGNLF